MKVLFAVNNEDISESIVKKYQKEYKEIISYKNVYYFNAILKEIQRDKSYDRIVISEDLEAFAHTQYDQIDKFIFDKLDSISDEASNIRGNDTPIILICSDRRTKSEQMLVKLFGIGIYNAIIGNDRSVDEVCRLIRKPRLKKEAKSYYKIDAEEVNYQAENENDVSEMEIQNILAHYKSLGKNEDRYIDSFNNIAAQYNDTQLRIISRFLPLNVKAVLEERSPKYQQIMTFNNKVSNSLRYKNAAEEKQGPSEKLLKPKTKDMPMSKPVVIPNAVNMSGAKKLSKARSMDIRPKQTNINQEKNVVQQQNEVTNIEPKSIEAVETLQQTMTEQPVQAPVKRGRGRPRKTPVVAAQTPDMPVQNDMPTPVKRGRGRPRKNVAPEPQVQQNQGIAQEEVVLPGFEEEPEDSILPGFDVPQNNVQLSNQAQEETILPGFEEEPEETILPGFQTEERDTSYQNQYTPMARNEDVYTAPTMPGTEIEEPIQTNAMKTNNSYIQTLDISSLLTADKKIVSFVGTSKNGTSFIVNNVAQILSSMGISTAILDTTANRNSFYIYTKNEEELRKTASYSIENLVQGIARGIEVNKNLSVFTSLPDGKDTINNVDEILRTLVSNYSVILIDCDFGTSIGYFKQSQEVYLVQSMDILTIQPLTAFLRELKAKNVLDEKKLRIILNKTVKVRGVTEKTIIGGMAFYNDPAMSFMTELFDRNLIKYISIPFDEEVYVKYLENIINCEVDLKGYTKQFMQILKELANMIYPLVSGNSTYRPPSANYQNNRTFSPQMNNTLDQMKRNF